MSPYVKLSSACAIALLLACSAGEAGATLLTFDQARSATGVDVVPIQAGAGQQDNIGIDSLRFGQSPPPGAAPTLIPEPGSLALFAGGLAALGLLRRKERPSVA